MSYVFNFYSSIVAFKISTLYKRLSFSLVILKSIMISKRSKNILYIVLLLYDSQTLSVVKKKNTKICKVYITYLNKKNFVFKSGDENCIAQIFK